MTVVASPALRVKTIEGAELFHCERLSCWLAEERCARRHYLSKRLETEVVVSSHGKPAHIEDHHVCADCPIGPEHLAKHPRQGGKRNTATRQGNIKVVKRADAEGGHKHPDHKRQRKPKSPGPQRTKFAVGSVLGIFTVTGVNGKQTRFRCDRCKKSAWSGRHDTSTMSRLQCCRHCPYEVRRANGMVNTPKTTEAQRARIVERFQAGEARTALAKEYGFSFQTITDILGRAKVIRHCKFNPSLAGSAE